MLKTVHSISTLWKITTQNFKPFKNGSFPWVTLHFRAYLPISNELGSFKVASIKAESWIIPFSSFYNRVQRWDFVSAESNPRRTSCVYFFFGNLHWSFPKAHVNGQTFVSNFSSFFQCQMRSHQRKHFRNGTEVPQGKNLWKTFNLKVGGFHFI